MKIFSFIFLIAAAMFTFFITFDEGSLISRAGAQEAMQQPPVCHQMVRQADGSWQCQAMRASLYRASEKSSGSGTGCRTMADINRKECDGLGILAGISVANHAANSQQADEDAGTANDCRQGWQPSCEVVGVLPDVSITHYGSAKSTTTAHERTPAEMAMTECLRQDRVGCALK